MLKEGYIFSFLIRFFLRIEGVDVIDFDDLLQRSKALFLQE